MRDFSSPIERIIIMWKEFIESFPGEYTFAEPAAKDELCKLEELLKVELPEELKSFLHEANGVLDEYHCPLVWSVQQIIHENLELRNFEDFKDLYYAF